MALALKGQQPIPEDHPAQIRLAQLLFSFHGRINRSRFFAISLAVAAYYFLIAVLVSSSTVADNSLAISTAILILIGGWVVLAILAKRLHDRNRPAWLLLTSVLVVPIAWLVFELFLARGTAGENHYGPEPSPGG